MLKQVLETSQIYSKPHYAALNDYLRESNQQQFYHYIYYDKYREVYYRLATRNRRSIQKRTNRTFGVSAVGPVRL